VLCVPSEAPPLSSLPLLRYNPEHPHSLSLSVVQASAPAMTRTTDDTPSSPRHTHHTPSRAHHGALHRTSSISGLQLAALGRMAALLSGDHAAPSDKAAVGGARGGQASSRNAAVHTGAPSSESGDDEPDSVAPSMHVALQGSGVVWKPDGVQVDAASRSPGGASGGVTAPTLSPVGTPASTVPSTALQTAVPRQGMWPQEHGTSGGGGRSGSGASGRPQSVSSPSLSSSSRLRTASSTPGGAAPHTGSRARAAASSRGSHRSGVRAASASTSSSSSASGSSPSGGLDVDHVPAAAARRYLMPVADLRAMRVILVAPSKSYPCTRVVATHPILLANRCARPLWMRLCVDTSKSNSHQESDWRSELVPARASVKANWLMFDAHVRLQFAWPPGDASAQPRWSAPAVLVPGQRVTAAVAEAPHGFNAGVDKPRFATPLAVVATTKGGELRIDVRPRFVVHNRTVGPPANPSRVHPSTSLRVRVCVPSPLIGSEPCCCVVLLWLRYRINSPSVVLCCVARHCATKTAVPPLCDVGARAQHMLLCGPPHHLPPTRCLFHGVVTLHACLPCCSFVCVYSLLGDITTFFLGFIPVGGSNRVHDN